MAVATVLVAEEAERSACGSGCDKTDCQPQGDNSPMPIAKAYVPHSFWEACQVGNLRIVRTLLEGDPSLANEPTTEEGIPPLHWAALNGRWHIARLLLQRGARVNTAAGSNGQTALHWAASKGHPAVASLLLENGADPLVGDRQAQTALHVAAREGQPWVALLLLAANVPVDQPDGQGRTPLFWAVYHGRSECTQILLQEGAQVNGQNNALGPLHYAALKGHREVCRLLLEAGADSEARDGQGKSAADWAAEKGHWEWYNQLLRELRGGSRVPLGVRKALATKWLPLLGFPLMMLLPSLLTHLLGGRWWLGLLLSGAALQLMRMAWGQALPGQRSSETSTIHWLHHGLNVTGVAITLFNVIPASFTERWPWHLLNLAGSAQVIIRLHLLGRTDPGRVPPPKGAEQRRRVGATFLISFLW